MTALQAVVPQGEDRESDMDSDTKDLAGGEAVHSLNVSRASIIYAQTHIFIYIFFVFFLSL